MKLSKRLETVASFVTQGSNIADIGTDHGYIPIYLIREGIACHAVAMDVRKGPLKRADAHVSMYGLTEKIETRLSDGLQALQPGEADTVIIAGMGGELVIHILEQGKHMWDSVAQWILSPQSDLDKVRRYLVSHGFQIRKETMLEEDGKFYTVMKAVPGSMEYGGESHYLYGRYLIYEKNPVLARFLEKEKRLKEEVLARISIQDTKGARERLETLKQELQWIKEVQDEMQ